MKMMYSWLAANPIICQGPGRVFLLRIPSYNDIVISNKCLAAASAAASSSLATGLCAKINKLTSGKPKKDNAFKVGVLGSDSFAAQNKHGEEEEEFRVLSAVRSSYNNIVIVDSAQSRFLLLDSTNNVHSIFNKQGQIWTESYWDEFATLPAIVPKGPIVILGLGGGTAARSMLESWPSLQLHGWEIDEILIDKARDYLGLSDLEKPTEDGGILHVHIGDAFSILENDFGKYAGIVVDLFSDGKVLAQLQEVATWLELKNILMPNGRLMVNCGGIDGNPIDGSWAQNTTIKALNEAFPGQLSWKRTPKEQGENYLALSGPLPDLTSWSAKVSGNLSEGVKQWKPCGPLS